MMMQEKVEKGTKNSRGWVPVVLTLARPVERLWNLNDCFLVWAVNPTKSDSNSNILADDPIAISEISQTDSSA